ncbi:MAG: response regulator [Nitrospirota bacterium]
MKILSGRVSHRWPKPTHGHNIQDIVAGGQTPVELEMRKEDSSLSLTGGTETILAAEDDAALRKLIKTVLESFGYTVILAEDGDEAVTKFEENNDKIQLCILDMIMPKKNGKEVYEDIKKIRPDVKFLFASGYTADIIYNERILDEGMDLILKPVSPRDLLRKVREALDR